MKNQIDQSTPFLAFYDLLRIRGIYAEPEKREKLRRGFRRAMALAAVVLSFALPQRAEADSVLATKFGGQTATIAGGTTYDLGDFGLSAVDGKLTLMTTGDDFTINGNATVFKNTSGYGWLVDGGTLTSSTWVYFLSPKGIEFSGGTINVQGLVAAAMSSFEFGTTGTDYKPSDVTGDIKLNGTVINTAAAANQFFIGRTVTGAPDGATVLETSGLSASDTSSDVTFSVGGSGTIKFVNAKLQSGTVSSAAGIDSDLTQSGGKLKAANVTGKLTQSGGTATVSGNIATLEHTTAAADTTSASAATIGTIVQAGAGTITVSDKVTGAVTQSGGTITTPKVEGAVTQTAGTLNGSSGLEITGTLDNSASSGSVVAGGNLKIAGGSVKDSAVTATKLVQTGGTLAVSDNELGIAFRQEGGTANVATFTAGVEQKAASGSAINATTISGGVTQESDNAGTVSSTTVNGGVTQAAGNTGTISATQVNGTVEQTAGTIQAKDAATGLSFDTAFGAGKQQGELKAENGTITLAGGDTLTGTIAAKTLVLSGGTTQSGGAVTADEVILAAAGADITLDQANAIQKVGGAAQKVTLNTTTALEQKALTATGDVGIEAGGNITVSGDLSAAGKSVVLKATGAGSNVTVADGKKITANALGIEAGTIPSLDGNKLSGVTALALRAKTGDVTLNDVPAGVAQNIGVVAEQGNAEITSSAAGQTVAFADVTVTAGGLSVAADGIEATTGGVTVNLTGAGAALDTANVTAGGAVDIDVVNGTATLGTVNADGEVSVDAQTATVGTVRGKNGGNTAAGALSVTATDGNATVTDANVASAKVDATGTATLGTVVSGDFVDVDATTANLGTTTAGGAITVDATTATLGTTTGGSVAITADNANIADLTTDGAATITGTDVDAGNVTAGGAATITGTDVDVGNVTAGGAATITGDDVDAGDVSATGGNATIAGNDVDVGNVNASATAAITSATSVDAGAVTAGGAANVTANAGSVNATSVNAGGAATVTATGGSITTAGALAGAGGTTATSTGAGSGITVGGALGGGGQTTATTPGALAAGTIAGGTATLDVGGAANANLNVGGDLNGTVDGAFTTGGGNAGSIGQDGGFTVGGAFTQNGALDTGAMTVQSGSYAMNGNLNAGGSTVQITAPGGIQDAGGATLASGTLTLTGGAIGTDANPMTLQTANGATLNASGSNVYLEEVGTGRRIQIGTISAGGELVLSAPNIGGAHGLQGGFVGGTVSSGGNMTLNVGGQFGAVGYNPVSLSNPVTVNVGGDLNIGYGNLDPAAVPDAFVHMVLNFNGGEIVLPLYATRAGFVLYQYRGEGIQVIGASPEQQRLINRALAFTVNLPELKSKQGIFGDPAMVHTKMNVSEARSMGNIDQLALNDVDFSRTWRKILDNASTFEVEWNPMVDLGEDSPLFKKMLAVKSEAEQQPEVMPFERNTGVSETAD